MAESPSSGCVYGVWLRMAVCNHKARLREFGQSVQVERMVGGAKCGQMQ